MFKKTPQAAQRCLVILLLYETFNGLVQSSSSFTSLPSVNDAIANVSRENRKIPLYQFLKQIGKSSSQTNSLVEDMYSAWSIEWDRDTSDHQWKTTVTKWNSEVEKLINAETGKNSSPVWIPAIMRNAWNNEQVPEIGEFGINWRSLATTEDSILYIAKALLPKADGVISNLIRKAKNVFQSKNFIVKYSNTCAWVIFEVHKKMKQKYGNLITNLGPIDEFIVPALLEVHKSHDSLVKEFLVMKSIEHLKIAATAIAVSVPIVVNDVAAWRKDARLKSAFVTSNDKATSCNSMHAYMRGLIEERVGKSIRVVHSSLEGRIGIKQLRDVVAVGLKLVLLLEKLHLAGFLHNDVHDDNVVFRQFDSAGWESFNSMTELPDIVLIDFGLAVFYPTYIGQPEEGNSEGLTLDYLSPGQLEGKRSGPFDDLYRAMETVAKLVVPDRLLDQAINWFATQNEKRSRNKAITDLKSFKSKTKLFTGSYFPQSGKTFKCPCQLLFSNPLDPNYDSCSVAMNHLQSAMDLILERKHVDDVPVYSEISSKFIDALHSLGGQGDYGNHTGENVVLSPIAESSAAVKYSLAESEGV